MAKATSKRRRVQSSEGVSAQDGKFDQFEAPPPALPNLPFCRGRKDQWNGHVPIAKSVLGAFDAGGILAEMFFKAVVEDADRLSGTGASPAVEHALLALAGGLQGDYDNRHRAALFFFRRLGAMLMIPLREQADRYRKTSTVELYGRLNEALARAEQ